MNRKFDVGDLVYVKKVYVQFVGYRPGPYIILGKVTHLSDSWYIILDPDEKIGWSFVDDDTIDKRCKWKPGK